MPDVTTLVMVGGVWALLLVLVWALCVAAARGDRQTSRVDAQESARRPTVVADTGAIRALLQQAMPSIRADQLTVTVVMDGRDAVLASARAVLEAQPGTWPSKAVPVRVGGRTVAMLRAARRPGERRFDAADMLVMQEIAARVAASMHTAHPSAGVSPEADSAMA